MRKALGLGLVLLFALASPNPAVATYIRTAGAFNITFFGLGETNAEGTVGGGDWTEEQMNAAVESAFTWEAGITNTAARQVRLQMFWTESSTFLGAASSPQYAVGGNAFTLAEYAWRDGQTYTGSYSYDTYIVYDMTPATTYTWNFGTGAPTSQQFDFQSVLTHEIGHALGWGGTYDSTGDGWWAGGTTAWDKNLRDSAGNVPAAGSTGNPGNFGQLDSPVYWTGANANAVYGAPVPIYAPATYSSGSSLSHIDTGTFPNYTMAHSIANGVEKRELSPIEWAMMKDMGWGILEQGASATPEPATLVLVGLGLMMVRRRKRDAEGAADD